MRKAIYWATFFFTLNYAFLLYINSSFLGKFFSEAGVNALYAGSAVIAILSLSKIPHIINHHRRYWVTSSLLIIGSLASIGLAFSVTPLLIAALFLLINAIQILLRFILDIYLEQFSRVSDTGMTRAIELTVMNVAVAISPFIVGTLTRGQDFSLVYLTAGLLLIPTLIIILVKFSKVKHKQYVESNFFSSLGKIWKIRALRSSFAANFLLEFFYTWMTIYVPIYLSQVIGFSWSEIGIILTIMLLPFIFFELPFGKIADALTGEGSILSIGFFLAAFFTLVLAFLHTKNLYAWAMILFMTRIGASAIEIMSEAHFFKNVSIHDANLLGVFRDTRPLALMAAPLVGNLIMPYYGYTGIYIALAVIMLWGVKYGFEME